MTKSQLIEIIELLVAILRDATLTEEQLAILNDVENKLFDNR